jgi:hypothetical protein
MARGDEPVLLRREQRANVGQRARRGRCAGELGFGHELLAVGDEHVGAVGVAQLGVHERSGLGPNPREVRHHPVEDR